MPKPGDCGALEPRWRVLTDAVDNAPVLNYEDTFACFQVEEAHLWPYRLSLSQAVEECRNGAALACRAHIEAAEFSVSWDAWQVPHRRESIAGEANGL